MKIKNDVNLQQKTKLNYTFSMYVSMFFFIIIIFVEAIGATKETLLDHIKAIENTIEAENYLQLDETSTQLSLKVPYLLLFDI